MKKALIIGAAISGIGAARLLNKYGYRVYLTDAKEIKERKELEAEGILCFDNGHPDSLKDNEYDLIVKNPGIPYRVPFVRYFTDKGYKMYNEMEIACRFSSGMRIAAVTGTNGKTTTATLLGAILEANSPYGITAGNMGVSLCDIVRDHPEERRDVGLEIAALQLIGTETFHPHTAVIMNLTPDHLDYFGTLDNYYHAKTLIYRNMTKDDTFFFNADDPVIAEYCQDIPASVVKFSTERTDTELRAEDGKVMLGDVCLFETKDLHIPGKHNLQNAMVAAGMAYKMDVPTDVIQQVISSFKGVEHRIEYTATINGVRYYNDSKGTNPDAVMVALKAFDEPIHLLAGGYDKKLPFDSLAPFLPKIKQMYVYGATKDALKKLDPRALEFNDMNEAIHAAYERALPGEVVLLSPACASWDQFPNYEVRGKIFKEIVRSLPGKKE
ncbi:MAG: UDP-N-acetylmuramoyl-L-alanine--D-glutamate ligase [Erysipelotrichales bacterium]|nr:UDP-N-acetylmuramoyl-L-alanine--D-glutamate ligase [Erysipelotrichales bacterium]MBQ2478237.1 UDP-N-acetylmuramoyl-L-alanine--D-glutamate ligase [Erysipelotrichales bacterium]